MERNDSGTLYAGGVVVVIVVFIACIKMIKQLFIELGKTFDAFAGMAKALTGLFIHVAIDVGLIAAAIAAIYFTYRYVKMVIRATDLRKEVDDRLAEFSLNLETNFTEFRESVDMEIRFLRSELREALKEPEVVPDAPSQHEASIQPDLLLAEPTTSAAKEEATNLSAIQNPY